MSETTTPRTECAECGTACGFRVVDDTYGGLMQVQCRTCFEFSALQSKLDAALDAVKRRDAEVNLLFYDKLALGCCPPYPREACSNQESCEVCWRNWIKTKLEG